MSRAHLIASRVLGPLTGALLFLQSALVVTGGGVRLTGSGLGCPTWPECTDGSYLPVEGQIEGALHSWIEFGNRLLTFVLFFVAIATLIAVIKTERRDLRFLATTQVAGILGQGALGGVTVLTKLNPLAVASHFILSILLIAAATSLFARRHRPQVRTSSNRLFISRLSLTHILWTFAVLVIGTLVTGSGPHAGDINAPRLHFYMPTITYIHAGAVIILISLSVIFYAAASLPYRTKRLLVLFILICLAQGALGYIQYLKGVPELLVGIHLLGSVITWIVAWRVRLSIVTKPA